MRDSERESEQRRRSTTIRRFGNKTREIFNKTCTMEFMDEQDQDQDQDSEGFIKMEEFFMDQIREGSTGCSWDQGQIQMEEVKSWTRMWKRAGFSYRDICQGFTNDPVYPVNPRDKNGAWFGPLFKWYEDNYSPLSMDPHCLMMSTIKFLKKEFKNHPKILGEVEQEERIVPLTALSTTIRWCITVSVIFQEIRHHLPPVNR